MNGAASNGCNRTATCSTSLQTPLVSVQPSVADDLRARLRRVARLGWIVLQARTLPTPSGQPRSGARRLRGLRLSVSRRLATDANAPPPGPKWLRMLLGDDAFARVETIQFGNEDRLKDADLEVLEGLDDLRILSIFGNSIDDEGLRHLKGLRNLYTLSLSGDKISDKGLDNLSRTRESPSTVTIWKQDRQRRARSSGASRES